MDSNKRAILVFVPVPQLVQYQKMIKERNLIEELEKKFSGKQVLIVAQRRIIRKEGRNTPQLKQKRPYRLGFVVQCLGVFRYFLTLFTSLNSRTLTAVHEAILDDLVYPSEIVGKRIRYRRDGSRLHKIHLHHDLKIPQDKVGLEVLLTLVLGMAHMLTTPHSSILWSRFTNNLLVKLSLLTSEREALFNFSWVNVFIPNKVDSPLSA